MTAKRTIGALLIVSLLLLAGWTLFASAGWHVDCCR